MGQEAPAGVGPAVVRFRSSKRSALLGSSVARPGRRLWGSLPGEQVDRAGHPVRAVVYVEGRAQGARQNRGRGTSWRPHAYCVQ